MVLWEALLPHHPKGFGDSSAISHLSALFSGHFHIMTNPNLKSMRQDSLARRGTDENISK